VEGRREEKKGMLPLHVNSGRTFTIDFRTVKRSVREREEELRTGMIG
jgi:hypothetical protein